ncbi:MAG: divalent-cation tolerance protein CutA [Comamonas sp.]
MPLPLVLAPLAIVTTTVATQAQAQQLAQDAIHSRLAACAQLEAITSHYQWQGQLEHSAEWRVVFKTVPDAVQALWQWLQSAHPYEVPQLLLRTEQADAAYAAWVNANVVINKSC